MRRSPWLPIARRLLSPWLGARRAMLACLLATTLAIGCGAHSRHSGPKEETVIEIGPPPRPGANSDRQPASRGPTAGQSPAAQAAAATARSGGGTAAVTAAGAEDHGGDGSRQASGDRLRQCTPPASRTTALDYFVGAWSCKANLPLGHEGGVEESRLDVTRLPRLCDEHDIQFRFDYALKSLSDLGVGVPISEIWSVGQGKLSLAGPGGVSGTSRGWRGHELLWELTGLETPLPPTCEGCSAPPSPRYAGMFTRVDEKRFKVDISLDAEDRAGLCQRP